LRFQDSGYSRIGSFSRHWRAPDSQFPILEISSIPINIESAMIEIEGRNDEIQRVVKCEWWTASSCEKAHRSDENERPDEPMSEIQFVQRRSPEKTL
jgi:hypothetical protein